MLKEAPYNPRVMDEHGHKLLNKSLKKSGLVETIVWNKGDWDDYACGGKAVIVKQKYPDKIRTVTAPPLLSEIMKKPQMLTIYGLLYW